MPRAAKTAAARVAPVSTVTEQVDPVVPAADDDTEDDTAPPAGNVESTTTDFGGGVSVTVEVTDPVGPPAAAMYAGGAACVVRDGTPHMGRGLPKVCSAHTNRYRPDGSPRTPIVRRAASK